MRAEEMKDDDGLLACLDLPEKCPVILGNIDAAKLGIFTS